MVDLIVAGSTCQVLAKEIADELGVELASTTVKRFPDGELYFRLNTPVKGREVAVVQSTSRPQDENIFELLVTLETLKREGAGEITAVVPYYGYGRQDRSFSEGEAITSKVVAELISRYAHRFISLNLHKSAILEYFEIEAEEGDATPAVAEYYSTLGIENAIVVAPDKGALTLAKNLASFIKAEYDFLEKKRLAPGEVEIKPKNLSVQNRNVVIYDDIIDSGGSMAEAIKVLLNQGASRIFVSCIHGVLSGNAVTRLFSAGVSDLVATNTIPSQISFITVSEIIAEMLK